MDSLSTPQQRTIELSNDRAANLSASHASIARSVSWATLGRALNAVLSFGLLLAAARLLPANELGAYLVFLFAAGPIALLGQLGLAPLLARLASAQRQQTAQRGYATEDISTPAGLMLCSVALLLLALLQQLGLGALLQQLLSTDDKLQLLSGPLFSAFFCSQAFAVISAEALKAQGKIREASIGVLILAPLTALLLLIGLFVFYSQSQLSVNASHFIYAGIAGYALSALYSLAALWRNAWLSKIAAIAALALRLIPDCLPILAAGLFAFTCAQLDMFFAAVFFSAEEVALYGLALRTLQLLLLPLQIANSFAAPFVADFFHRDRQQLSLFSQQVSSVCLLLGIAASALILLAFPWLAEGNTALAGHTILLVPAILVIGQLFNCGTSLAATNLEIGRQPRAVLQANALAAVLGTLGFVLAGSFAGLLIFAAVSAAMRVLQNILLLRSNQQLLGVQVAASRQGIATAYTAIRQKVFSNKDSERANPRPQTP